MDLNADDFNQFYPVGSKVVTRWGTTCITLEPAVTWSDGIPRVPISPDGFPCDLKEIARVIPD
jgi:hypothetical protein